MDQTARDAPKLVRVQRLDSISLDGREKTYFTDEGYLIDHPILTSVGIFEYKNSDGSVRKELRLPEHVFKKESLQSYRGKPIIVTHSAGVVDKDNVEDETIGTILSDGYQDGGDVRAEIVIHDTDRMRQSGLKELSLGYNLDLIEEPGEWEGQHYDAIQTNIVVNHLALVEVARAGNQARLNIDGSDKEPEEEGGKLDMNGDAKTTPTANGDDLTPEELKEAIAAFKANKAEAAQKPTEPNKDGDPENKEANADNADGGKDCGAVECDTQDNADNADGGKSADDGEESKMDGDSTAESGNTDNQDGATPEQIIDGVIKNKDNRDSDPKKALEQANADIDKMVAVANKLLADKKKADNKDSSEDESKSMNKDSADIEKLVDQRVAIIRIGDKLHMDGIENMDTASAKKAIIGKVYPDIRLDGQTDTYVDCMYDLAVGEVNRKKDVDYQRQQMVGGEAPAGMHTDSADKTMAESARERMIAREGGNE